jgi:hypothetical protein
MPKPGSYGQPEDCQKTLPELVCQSVLFIGLFVRFSWFFMLRKM